MPGELERRLTRAFRGLPAPAHGAERRARIAALAVLPPPSPRSARRRVLIASVAGLAAVLTLGAAALAASGQIHLQLGTSHPRHVQPPPRHLVLPARTDGLALVTGGRLWVVAHGGVRIERLPVTTAALSPRALYVAVGAGRSLAAMAPSGRRAWAITTPGAVVAVAWAPSGLEVAYVVRRRARDELWLVEGDGDHAHRLASAGSP